MASWKGKWRPVDIRLWDDRKFLACSDDARLLWLFLLTCPSLPIPGVVIGGDATLAEMLGWTPERLRERFHEVARNGLQVTREGRVVWLKNALKYQPPMNPNMVKGWAKKWDDVPEGQLKLELWEELRIACKSWSILFGKLFLKPLQNGSVNGSTNGFENGSWNHAAHEHEHEHEHDLDQSLSPARAIPRAPVYPTRHGMGPSGEPQRIEPPAEVCIGDEPDALAQVDTEAATRAQPAGPAPEARMLLLELEQARSAAAAELGVDVQSLTMFDAGERDLADMLATARARGPAELDKLVRQVRHAIAMAKLETVSGEKPFEWFTGAVFRANNFRRLVGKTATPPRAGSRPGDRAGPRARDPSVGRIEPHQPEEYAQGDVKL